MAEIKLQIVTDTAAADPIEPVTLAEIKQHCRIDGSDDNAYLTAIIKAEREVMEEMTRTVLVDTTFDLYLDRFPYATQREPYGDAIEIPRSPVQYVDSITYIDADGETQTLDPAAYILDNTGIHNQIVPAYGYSWPTTRAQPNAVTVRFTAGFNPVPERYKLALKLIVADAYELREPVIVGQTVNRTPALDRLLNLCRTKWVD